MNNIASLRSAVQVSSDHERVDHRTAYEQIQVELAADLMSITSYCHTIQILNPLDPSTPSFIFHKQFVQLMNPISVDVLFLGINPGPHGMGNTGVPFGDPFSVSQFLSIDVPPDRSEVSGHRLWGLLEEICETKEQFFKHSYVQNLCPVNFTEGKRNITPSNTAVGDLITRRKIIEICDSALVKVLKLLRPSIIIAIGNEVEERMKKILTNNPDIQFVIKVVKIPHPSRANRYYPKDEDWRLAARNILHDNGVDQIMTSP